MLWFSAMRRLGARYCPPLLLGLAVCAGPVQAQEVLVRLDRATATALGKTPNAATMRMRGLNGAGDGRRLAERGPLADVLAVSVADSSALQRALATWASVPGVVSVQPNRRYTVDRLAIAPNTLSASPSSAVANDVPWDSLPGLVAAGVREAQRVTTGKKRVRVAFLDTGIWFDHPALQHAIWTNPGEIPGNGIDDDGNGFVDDVHGWDFLDRVGSTGFGDVRGRDNDPSEDALPGSGRGHGTSVAGVIAARYIAPTAASGPGFAYGVAPDVSLVPLRVCGADGDCHDDDVAAALVYAADMGFEVANLSFGTDYISEVLRDAVAYAVSKNVLVVASAGNQPIARQHYPSDYPDVLSVVWFNEDGSARAANAQFGTGVDLGAPASRARVPTLPLPDQQTKPGALYLPLYAANGSSLAAPLVAGAAALVLSEDSTLSAAAVRSLLAATADDLDAAGWDEKTGAGRIRVDRALLRSLPANLSIASPEQDGGTASDRLPIVGTVLDPSFVTYDVYYAAGDTTVSAWTKLGATQTTPRLRDTLAVWNTTGLPEGVYTLRVAVQLREGRALEERRRVWLDRTPPKVTVVRTLPGFQDDRPAALLEVTTDDLARVEPLRCGTDLQTPPELASDRIARRHGLVVPAEVGSSLIDCQVRATNRAGLTTVASARAIGVDAALPLALVETALSAPQGILLPSITDFDRDGRREITLNKATGEATSDTTQIFEWNGSNLALAQQVVVPGSSARPRDSRDSDGDGRAEILVQAGGTSGMLEASRVDGFPDGLATVVQDTLFGARLADLDGDGRGEILGHNTKAWRVYEWNGTAFARVAALPNPTPLGTGEVRDNLYSEPDAAIGDFDGDGQTDFAVADYDGDLVVYETRGNNTFAIAWQEASDRYAPRPKTAVGDFDGDGKDDFVVLRENFEPPRSSDREQEPPIATFSVYRSPTNDAYETLGSVSFPLPPTRYSAAAAADFDGDGRDELILAVGSRLYVLSWNGSYGPVTAGWMLRYYRGIAGRTQDADGLRSITLATGDLDGDGQPDLVAAMGNGRLARFTRASTVAAPTLTFAGPAGADSVWVAWSAPSADSTVLYRRAETGAFERVASGPGGTVAAAVPASPGAFAYAVRGWAGRAASGWSNERIASAGALQSLVKAVRLDSNRVRFEVDVPFATDDLRLLDLNAYAVPPSGTAPISARTVVSATQVRGFLATFDRAIPDGYTVRLTGTNALPLGPLSTAPSSTLFVVRADVLDRSRVRMVFSAPLDPSSIRAAGFRVEPSGTVAGAALDPSNASAVIVTLSGAVVGATGLSTAIVADGLRTPSGATLDPDGRAVRLTSAAADLSEAYVFPNPVRPSEAPDGAMIAGLPAEADVTVLSVEGQRLRTLEERDGDGGTRWDLRDDAGRDVPSGVYLVRIATTDGKATFVRVAVIR